MKTAVVLVLVALGACQSKEKKPPAPTPASASGSAPIVVDAQAAPAGVPLCELGRKAIDGAKCDKPEAQSMLKQAKSTFDGLVKTVGQSNADPTQMQVMCAQLVLALERDARKVDCSLALATPERQQIQELLDRWYSQRTPVTQTGDAAADGVIAKMAAVRDAACACKTQKCLDELDNTLVSIPVMPASAPQSARDLGTKVLEDAARCANRVRTLLDPK